MNKTFHNKIRRIPLGETWNLNRKQHQNCKMCQFSQPSLHNTHVKNHVKGGGEPCLYRMRTTFLLPLARTLGAFYRAIKAVNQSLLNDPWFLTCFTGSETVVAAHLHTWLCSLQPTYTIYDCLNCEHILWQGYCIAACISPTLVREIAGRGRRGA